MFTVLTNVSISYNILNNPLIQQCNSKKANLVEDEGRSSDDQELVAGEEEKEEEEDPLMENKINDYEKEINEEKEKEKEKNEKKNEKKEGERKTKSELAREKKKEVVSCTGKEALYPLVPSMKDKKRHLARFLGIFKKLEITIPFGEAL